MNTPDQSQKSKSNIGIAGSNYTPPAIPKDYTFGEVERDFNTEGLCKCDGDGIIYPNFVEGHNDYGRIFSCVCIDEKIDKRDTLMRISRLMDIKGKRLVDFEPNWNIGTQDALRLAQGWAAGTGNTFLTLYGTTGVGKRHLATGCALLLIERYQPIIFYKSADLVRDLQGKINTNLLDSTLHEIKNIENLIIDDLGREYSTEWTLSILHEIIDYRYSNDLRTLITTNHSLDELKVIVGNPVVSRLVDSSSGNLVVMDGTDIRPRLKELKYG